MLVSVYHRGYQGDGETLSPIQWPRDLLEARAIVCKTLGKRAAMASNQSFKARTCGRCHAWSLGRARRSEVKEG